MITLIRCEQFFNFVSFLLFPMEVKRFKCAMLEAFTVHQKTAPSQPEEHWPSSICHSVANNKGQGAQWLSGRVLVSRPSLTGVTVLWSLSETHLS